MKTTHLGRTGLTVSRICLGTMNFGPFTTEEDSFQIMDRALDAGIQFFDTANVYGRQAGKGATEKILGNARPAEPPWYEPVYPVVWGAARLPLSHLHNS